MLGIKDTHDLLFFDFCAAFIDRAEHVQISQEESSVLHIPSDKLLSQGE